MSNSTSQAPVSTSVTNVSPALLSSWLHEGTAILIDVREDFEHAEERIEGAISHPLSKFDAAALRSQHASDRVVFHCRSGKRSRDAAQRFNNGPHPTFHLDGGIDAWKEAGMPVVTPARGARLPIMRQVQIVAGSLVVVGIVLGFALSPWLFGISAFVGCGLVFAGVSGWCGMAKFLAIMPWNKSTS